MSIWRALVVALPALAVAVGACRSGPTDSDLPTSSPCASAAATLHDDATKKRLERAMARLARGGETPTLEQLAGQLERSATDAVSATAPPTEALAPAVLAARVRPSVVVFGKRFLCGNCDQWHTSTATGFAVAANAVATSRHVLDGLPDTTFAVLTAHDIVLPVVEVLAANTPSDVAIVRIAGGTLPPLPLRAGHPVGGAVHVMSHPDGAFWYFSSGVLARRFPFRHSSRQTVESLDVTAEFARGSSGGPVLDDTGAVIGLVRATNSVYYTEKDGEQNDLQMVFRRSTPAEALLDLMR